MFGLLLGLGSLFSGISAANEAKRQRRQQDKIAKEQKAAAETEQRDSDLEARQARRDEYASRSRGNTRRAAPAYGFALSSRSFFSAA